MITNENISVLDDIKMNLFGIAVMLCLQKFFYKLRITIMDIIEFRNNILDVTLRISFDRAVLFLFGKNSKICNAFYKKK